MRKKIFLIHGTGQKDGLGRESGGDLDTVSSNAFYGVWMEKIVDEQLEDDARYGVNYEFDFINYQEGLTHLDAHSGCDLYLPDFPLDALSPRLQMHMVRRSEAVDERCKLYEAVDQIRSAFYDRSNRFSEHWKNLHNRLLKQSGKYLKEKKYYEVRTARLYTELLFGVVRQIFNHGASEVTQRIEQYLRGNKFKTLRDDLAGAIDSDVKDEVLNSIDQHHVDERLMVDESSRADYGCMYRMKDGDHLLSSLIETLSVVTGTYFLIPHIKGVTEPTIQSKLTDWGTTLTGKIYEHLHELNGLLNQILDANPDHRNVKLMNDRCGQLKQFFDNFTYKSLMKDYEPRADLFQVHVTEEASGRPVRDLEVVFNVTQGDINLTPHQHETDKSAKNLVVKTDDQGYAAVRILGTDEQNDFGITATYDDQNFLSFPRTLELSDDYFKEHPNPDSIELQFFDYLDEGEEEGVESSGGNIDRIEEGTDTDSDRAVQVQQQMIDRHLRYLHENDVRLIRIDDHHPYTPAILEKLESLQDDGLIDSITLSSLPRGEHQPKEDQLCGADLIYRQFIKDTPADNDGLEKLCHATHLQDLHIEEDDMAIELSKLIGSRFSKVDMTKGLMRINSEANYENILQDTGWDTKITEYEQGLNKVLPRIDLTLHRLTYLIPPESGDYESEVDWSPFKYPAKYFLATPEEKQYLLREEYAQEKGRKVTFLCALSPFCDPDAGEPQINVASALNYLNDYYNFDYFMYAYGSMLLSTRRISEERISLDLSKLVSKIGSPSDGGHPGAATGSPEANPNFPVQRFDKVDHRNFSEYLYYISQFVEEHTPLEHHNLEELYPNQFEAGTRKNLDDLEKKAYHLNLRGSEGVAKILFASRVFTDQDEGDLTVPLALSHLIRNYPGPDYVFYSLSTSNLVLRNVNDQHLTLDLDKVARILGTHQDGGHQRAAICKPRFHPEFPEDQFDFIGDDNLKNYVDYIGDTLQQDYEFSEVDIRKAST